MTLDERLRAALHDEADSLEPDDAWDRITSASVAADRRARLRRRGVLGLAAVAMVAIIAGAVALAENQSQDVRVQPPVGSTEATDDSTTTSTSEAPTSTTSNVPPPQVVDTSTAVFTARLDDPVQTARTFMEKYVGMTDVVAGEFRQGDSRSGEVDVTPGGNDTLTTTVLVRQLDGDEWWVIGAESENIRLDSPAALDAVSSPVTVRGAARAFEGNVLVEVREDGQLTGQNLGQAPVTGSGGPDLGPFEGSIPFNAPTAPRGALVLTTASARDGSIQEATVVRVQFGTATTNEACAVPVPAGRTVKVFFLCEEQSLGSAERAIGDRPDVLRAALEALLAGPNQAESDAGLFSHFSEATAAGLNDVTIRSDGTAVVDLSGDLPEAMPNSSSSAASQAILRQLDATVFQFATVQRIEYRLDGSCEAFTEWLQRDACQPVTRQSAEG
jgi:hypothetical protein